MINDLIVKKVIEKPIFLLEYILMQYMDNMPIIPEQ